MLRARNRMGNDEPVEPAVEIKLEGELKVKAERLREELAAHLKEKGTEGLPKSRRRGEGDKADLMGAWLSGADLSEAQLQEANLTKAQLQNANLGGAQLQTATLVQANLKGTTLTAPNRRAIARATRQRRRGRSRSRRPSSRR